jgi:prolyl-tRNA synthetase
MVGGVIMTHGDDDGLRLPPKIAPQQVVILPMLRDKPEDEPLIEYCEALRATLASQHVLGEPLRVLLDTRPGKAAAKRWDYVRKGAPIIIEVGGRDMDNGVVSLLRRDRLWDEETGKPAFQTPTREVAGQTVPDILADMQASLLTEAAERREANITRGVTSFDEVEKFFTGSRYPGWVEVQWSKPTGEALEKVVERLKEHKLTIRNVPMDAAPVDGTCVFTGDKAVERVLLAKAY